MHCRPRGYDARVSLRCQLNDFELGIQRVPRMHFFQEPTRGARKRKKHVADVLRKEGPIAAVGRVAHRQSQRACFATELRVRLSMRGIRFTMIFTYSRISDAAKWQIVNSRLKHAFVERSISRGCRVQGLNRS